MKKYFQYIEDIKANKISHCKMVARAIERFEKDLIKSKDDSFQYYFDEEKADKIILFLQELKQFEGEFNNVKLVLEGWQCFIIANLIGWREKTNHDIKRYNRCFIEVARKNGKSILFSGLALENLLVESGAQIVSGATTRDQAKIILRNLQQFIVKNPDLKKVLKSYRQEIQNTKTAGRFFTLSRDAKSQDGLNVSFAVLDEVASMKDSYLIDVVQSSQGARQNPSLIQITTSGFNFNSPGYHEYEKSKKILNGQLLDDRFFCIIYEYDTADKWDEPKNFIKANPNLNISVKESYLLSQLTDAKNAPYKRAEFMVKHCNIWLKNNDGWIMPEVWNKTQQKELIKNIDLTKYPCYGGVDLAHTADLTAYTLCWFIPEMNKYILKHHFYCPENAIEKKFSTDSKFIYDWITSKWITPCNGDYINLEYLFEDINNDLLKYNIKAIGSDPYHYSELKKKFDTIVFPFSQTSKTMTPAITIFDRELLAGNIIELEDNPVSTWMSGNAQLKQLPNSLLKIQKISGDKSSGQRIDGIITTVIAVGTMAENNLLPVEIPKQKIRINFNEIKF